MTVREAVASLKTLCHTCELFPKCVNNKPECYQAIELAISALEKQIPKKVRVTTSTKRCSVCGRQLSGIGNIHPKRNYCQERTQTI